ncbi:hypothetical protein PanWU01x14_052420 [Parasponia andersonii]|uniref:Uncharacterized protein n=1 Tax=Parasponia andersonii TaxID=3476 RepID=A0A2P5DM89_PARAD|nr:hypothetical protein PanWU01x14_052420 [Parasponia andersonii]
MARPLGNLPPLLPHVLVPAKASDTIPIANSAAIQGTGRLNMEVVYIRLGEGRNDEWLEESKTRKSVSVSVDSGMERWPRYQIHTHNSGITYTFLVIFLCPLFVFVFFFLMTELFLARKLLQIFGFAD